jgi:hypothetical protein
MAVLNKHHDLPLKLRLAILGGVNPEHLARRVEGLLAGEPIRVIDRLRAGEGVSYHQLVCVERALEAIAAEAPSAER